MKKIKIAFFVDVLTEEMDGAIRTVHQLLSRIPNEDFEFLIICAVPPQKDIGIPIFEVPSMAFFANTSYQMGIPRLVKRKLLRRLDEFDPDIIHFTTPSPLGHFGTRYGRENNIPVVAIYHTHFISYIDYTFRKVPFMINPMSKLTKSIAKNIYTKCQTIYVPTPIMIKELVEIGIGRDKMKLWQRGIDSERFSPRRKDKAYMRQLTGNDNPNILFVSRLVWEKNLKVLLDFYKKNEQKGAPYNIVIAGEGIAGPEIRKKMPNAFFLGALDHDRLSVLYASGDIFFFPSTTESYGNVVIEAMASGIPVVVANAGGPTSFVRHEQNGILCDPHDVNDFIKQVDRLLADKALYHKLVQHGLEYTQALSWDNLANIYFEDIRTLKMQKVLA